jgi:hypothetical protein
MTAKKAKPGLKKWDVSVHFHVSGFIEVEAKTKKQALQAAHKQWVEVGQKCIQAPSYEVDIANGDDLDEIMETGDEQAPAEAEAPFQSTERFDFRKVPPGK